MTTTLREIISKVQEKNLSKEELEDYHADIVNVYALLQEELADIRKAKALYFMDNKEYHKLQDGLSVVAERSDVSIGRMWAVTEKGQREIEVSHLLKAIERLLGSLKTRIYRLLI